MPINQRQIKQFIEEYYPLFNLPREELEEGQLQTRIRYTDMLIQLINELAQQNNIDIASSNQEQKDMLIAFYRRAIQEPLRPFITRWAEEEVLDRYTAVSALRTNNVPDDQIDPIELSLFRDARVRQAIITDRTRDQQAAFLQECEEVVRNHFLSIPPRTPSPKHRRLG